MKKKYLFLLTIMGASALIAFGCQKAESEEESLPDQEEVKTQVDPKAKNTTPTTPTLAPEIKMNGNGNSINKMQNDTTNDMSRVPPSTPTPMNNGARTTGIPDSNRINGTMNNSNMNNSNLNNSNLNNSRPRPNYGPTSDLLENDPAMDATVQLELSEEMQEVM